MPLLMLLLMALPALIMNFVDSSATTVSVIDNSRVILPELKSSESVTFLPAVDATVDSALTRDGIDAVLVIPENIVDNSRAGLKYYSNGPSSIGTESNITDQVNKIIESRRLHAYNITDIDKILDNVRSDVSLTTVRADKDSEESDSSAFSYAVGIGMTFVLYMFLLIYGQMVMTSIIEEKGNRVLEVVVSSVKPAQLMMGKIVGVALVAVTQMIILGILLAVMSAYLLPALIPADAMADVAAVRERKLRPGKRHFVNRNHPGRRYARQCRPHHLARRTDDTLPRVRLPALLFDFRRRRLVGRQYSGRKPANLARCLPHHLRPHLRNGSRGRPDGKRGLGCRCSR